MSRVSHVGRAVAGASLMVAWRLEGRRVLVVGGGAVASDRVRLALEAGGEVRVVAPRLSVELARRVERDEIEWTERRFEVADLEGVDLLLTAIDDVETSRTIVEAARARRIPVNAADQPDLCDFWFPSVWRDGPVQLAVATAGQGPGLARRLRDLAASALPAGIGETVRRFGRLRRRIREVDSAPENSGRRMRFLGRVGRSWSWADLAALDAPESEVLVSDYLDGATPPEGPRPRGGDSPVVGKVTLVGAGPGDPSLLTEAAQRALEEADLVVADRLVSPEVLALVGGELRVARKLPGRAAEAQRELEQWVIDAARAGRRVVRLKCGDPFVFGRGLEELERFAAEGLFAAVVPGVSSVFAAPLAAGIPVTHRGLADRVLVLTARGAGGSEVEVPGFDSGTTYLWLMAVSGLETTVASLLAAGHPADWPCAVVERGARDGQRALRTTLADLPGRVRALGFGAPAVIVIGRVVAAAARDAFEWDGLAGETIAAPAVARR